MRIRFTITRKLLLGFLVLLALVITTNIRTILRLEDNMEVSRKISNVYAPSASYLNDMYFLIINSKMLIKNWVHIDKKETEDKRRLRKIHAEEFPVLKEKLDSLSPYWDDPTLQVRYNGIIASIDSLYDFHKSIMADLKDFDSYGNVMVVFNIIPRLEEQGDITMLTSRIEVDLNNLRNEQNEFVKDKNLEMERSFEDFQKLIQWMAAFSVIFIMVIFFVVRGALVRPINFIKQVILDMGKGILPKEQLKIRKDEIGEMSNALNLLVNGLKTTSQFSLRIGEGKYDHDFTPLSDQDVLGTSLLIMRDNLKKAAIEEERRKEENMQRNWSAQGIALFSEILRQNNDNIDELAFEVISNMVKYLEANIGGLFVINDDEQDKSFIELKASYAFERKKFIEKRIEIGVNLVGQCVQEGETVYLTDIPDDYVKITSGLGEDAPKSLLIVPLKVNNEVFGVVEIASFKQIHEYQIKFIERVGESVASSISSVKINMNTAQLLIESQEKSERLAQQEEEMRQNIEEMQATQDELIRKFRLEKNTLEGQLEAINSSNGVVEFSLNGEFLNANNKFIQIAEVSLNDVKGNLHSEFLERTKVNSLEYQTFWSNLRNGMVHATETEYFFNEKGKWFFETYAAVKNEKGQFYKVLALVSDISVIKEREHALKRQMTKANQEIDRLKEQLTLR